MKEKLVINTELVKQLMQNRGLNIKMLADKMQVSPQTIRRFLKSKNHSYYRASFFVKVSSALKVLFSEIIL